MRKEKNLVCRIFPTSVNLVLECEITYKSCENNGFVRYVTHDTVFEMGVSFAFAKHIDDSVLWIAFIYFHCLKLLRQTVLTYNEKVKLQCRQCLSAMFKDLARRSTLNCSIFV